MKNSCNQLSIGKYTDKYHRYLHSYICKHCHKKIDSLKSSRKVYISGYCIKHHSLVSSYRKKKVSLRFFKSKKVWNYDSLTNFCKPRIHSLGKNAKYHFAEVLNGKRLHYKGWLRADNPIKIDLNKVKKISQLLIKQAIKYREKQINE